MSLPAHLDALLDDLRPAAARAAARHRRDHRLRFAAAALAVAAVFAGAALAATRLLGDPAPPAVQSQLHAMARFVVQPGLREQTARVVATAPDATLYGVYDERGNYCVELIGARRGLVFAFSCGFAFGTRSAEAGGGAMGAAPQQNVIVDGVVPPVVVFGKLRNDAVAADALLGDGTRERVEIGLGGFFLYEPSAAKQPVARRRPIQIVERNAAGGSVWQTYFAPPIALATTDRRVSGTLEIAGATQLLVGEEPGAFPRPQPVRVGPDGSFSWVAPAGRGLGIWTAVDRNGRELATAQAVPEELWRQLLEQARG
jgi:hypothetical protein